MKTRKPLTGRQRLFVERFALTGQARKSAIAAGTNPSSAAVRANRWLKKPAVRESVQLIRELAFEDLRNQITNHLMREVDLALRTGILSRRLQRAQRLMFRLGIYPCNPFARE
jgi:phage terminase small subunit